MIIRKATREDINAIADVYSGVHAACENGELVTGWIRNVYPTKAFAETALERDDLYVLEAEESIVGTAIINQIQPEAYRGAKWKYDVSDEDILVLKTLAINPSVNGRGYGKAFMRFYEAYAARLGCKYLRLDTNQRNDKARAFYNKLGYEEIDIVPCEFNGIPDVHLVLLEKYIG